VKIINNLVAIVISGAVAEGLALAEACGIDQDAMLDMLNVSSAASSSSRNWKATRDAQKARTAAGGVLYEMAAKDMDLALSLGRSARQMLPLAAVMSQRVQTIYP
jgi:3-hydroxyisobutyrate dehydrogenase-like beta-hydroxyacid dehydrogenase